MISSKDDNDEESEPHSKSDNIEIMMNDEANEVIEEIFESLKNGYQNQFEESRKDSEFVYDYVHLLYYKCHKIKPNCGGSYIDSPDWIKNKEATINAISRKNDKCFQYALNHEEIKKDLQGISKYNWKGINCPSEKDDWKNSRNCSKSFVC